MTDPRSTGLSWTREAAGTTSASVMDVFGSLSEARLSHGSTGNAALVPVMAIIARRVAVMVAMKRLIAPRVGLFRRGQVGRIDFVSQPLRRFG